MLANRARSWPRKLATPIAAAIAMSLPMAPARALSLGDIEVSSSLGQPLRARVPVALRLGENLSPDCISVVRADPFGGEANGLIASANVELRNLAGKNVLFVSSAQAIDEPLARLLLRVSCSDGGSIYREYTLLLDPPQYQTAHAGAQRLAQMPPPPSVYTQQIFSGVKEYTVQEGDTLDSIVKQRYPYNPRLQRRLRQAIATANSDVLPSVDSALPQAGTPLLIPDLPAPPPQLAKAPKPPAVKPKRSARTQAALPPRPRASATEDVLAPAQASPPPRPIAAGSQEFVLRLSRSALDTNRPVSDAERVSLRERQRLLDADDLTASMLSLQHEMRQMKAEVEALKAQLRQQGASAGTPTAGAVAPESAPQPTAAATDASAPKWYERWTPLAQQFWWVAPAIALAGLVIAMLRRRRLAGVEDEFEAAVPVTRPTTQAPTMAPAPPTVAPATQAPRATAKAAETAHATREHDVQARYLADRFPELAETGIDLADTEAVVEQSRVYFMEDGAADKAIELLEYTTSKHPDQPKPWLALLEIYRQMKMKGAFEKHAISFRDRFKDMGQWKRVCAIGKALDPQNALYEIPADESPIETAAVENSAAEMPEGELLSAQNWLDIPLDFTPALRGEKLRSELLSELPEDRPEPKASQQLGVHTIDFDLSPGQDQPESERVEPKLARRPSQ